MDDRESARLVSDLQELRRKALSLAIEQAELTERLRKSIEASRALLDQIAEQEGWR